MERLIEVRLSADVQDTPDRFQIAPAGMVKTTKGEFMVDEQAYSLIKTEMKRRGVDTLVDYEHHSEGGEFAAPDGLVRAAGWIKDMVFDRQRGLQAQPVNWTPRAKELIASGEYRYVSPVVLFRLSDRRAVRIKSVALTNTPATLGIEPLVAKDVEIDATDREGVPSDSASEDGKDDAMKNRLIGVLALKADASEDEIVAAVRAAHEKAGTIVAAEAKASQASETLTLVCKAAGISESEPGKIEAQMMVLAQKAKDHDTLKAEVDRLHSAALKDEADRLIGEAKAAGKLVEAQEEWARTLILKDKASFEAWMQTAAVIRPQGQTTPPPATSTGESKDRTQIILSARKEWAEDKALQQLTSEKAYVADALRLKEQPELKAQEIETLALKE
ncbi:MAG TPA: phage protease [Phycisphaerae bacterium]|nr:phage protease [Phycisphaerae bacterium]HON69221.1 phage protease [Phycisphaerae bacterium]HPP29275.1 phage protease [Phycisphaerae bacterium]